jgi:uncharacterized membrane protein YqjE
MDLILYVLGFAGLIVLLAGIFWNQFTYGLIAALIIWFIAGATRRYFGIPKNRNR